MTDKEREDGRRADFIQGLRAFADWLEARPGVPCVPSTSLYGFVDTADELRAAAACMDTAKEVGHDERISAFRSFPGGVVYSLHIRQHEAVPTPETTLPGERT